MKMSGLKGLNEVHLKKYFSVTLGLPYAATCSSRHFHMVPRVSTWRSLILFNNNYDLLISVYSLINFLFTGCIVSGGQQ